MKLSHFKNPIFLVLLLAIGLRLPLLNTSFWLDEAAQALESARPFAEQLEIIPDFQPPLIHLITHFALYFSSSEWWLRTITALIPGVLSILITYKIAQQAKVSKVGIIAAVLLATNSLHIFYSQELRPYALPTLWAVLSWWSLQKLLVAKKNQVLKASLLLVVCSSLGLYSSFLFIFLMLSQLVWMLISHRAQLKTYVASSLAALVTFIPWLPTFKLQIQAGGLLRQDLPGWSEVVSLSQLKSLPLVGGKFIYGVLNLELSNFFIMTGLALTSTSLLAIFFWFRDKKYRIKINSDSFEFQMVCWLLIPLLAAWIVSFWIPIIQPKRVLFLLPAFYLLISSFLMSLKTTHLKWLSIGLLLAVNVYSVTQYYVQPKLQRENWRSLQNQITQKYSQSNTVVIFAFPEPFAPWRWYDQGEFQTLSLGYLGSKSEPEVSQQLKTAAEKEIVIIFDYLTDLSDPQHDLIKTIESFGFKSIEVIDYPNIGFVRVYSRPGMTVSLR